MLSILSVLGFPQSMLHVSELIKHYNAIECMAFGATLKFIKRSEFDQNQLEVNTQHQDTYTCMYNCTCIRKKIKWRIASICYMIYVEIPLHVHVLVFGPIFEQVNIQLTKTTTCMSISCGKPCFDYFIGRSSLR